MLARTRAAELHEWFEDRAVLVRRNAWPSVLHADSNAIAVGGAAHDDASAFGRELHGIREQIQNDLLSLRLIGNRREIDRARLARERNVLCLRLRGEQRQHGVHHTLNRDDREIVGHLSRLDPAVVEQVTDDAEEVQLAAANAREVALLLLRDRATDPHLEQLGVATNGIQGRAQLVRHRREKLALRAVRHFSLRNATSVGDRALLRGAAFGEVARHLREADQLSSRVADRSDEDVGPEP